MATAATTTPHSIKSNESPSSKSGAAQARSKSKVDIGDSWRDIIFLPFNRFIASIFMLVTYLTVMYNIYLLTYQPRDPPFLVDLMLGVICEFFYFIFMVVIVLHRVMRTHRKRMIYRAHPIFLILVDFISVLPLENLYESINRYTWENHFTTNQIAFDKCYLKFVRIIRLSHFYFDLRRNLTNNQTVIIIMCHLLASIFVIFCIGSIYHYVGIHPPPKESATWLHRWLHYNATFDRTNNFNWFIICTYEIAGLYFNNSLRTLKYTNMNDTLLIFFAMLLGFISQYTFLLGTLTSEEMQGMRAKYNLQLRLKAAKTLMATLMMPPHLQKTVQVYYETIWNHRFGVVTMPDIVRKLPPFMQSEIVTDIYWEALLHTKIFNNVSSVFRKVIAEQMKTEIYMQGHLVYREKDIKAKLVYLQSGMLEIYTMEADNSRITLTSGTVLCEVSCIQMSKCTANVRCVTNCTLHVLYMVDFYNALLKNYQFEFKTIRKTYHSRIDYCKNKMDIVGKQVRMSHMRWVKNQWRRMFEQDPNCTFEPYFTSRFLDMIAIISSEVNPKAFCLRGDCPFVMVTDTPLYFTFYYLALVATAVNFFISFKDIFFEGQVTLDNYKYYALIDTVFFLDIYVQGITTIKRFTHIIDQPYEILVYKLKNVFYVLDILATIPVDYFGVMVGLAPSVLGIMRINRYIRLYKIILFFHYHEKRVTSYAGVLKVLKFLVYHILISFLLTCIVYICNCTGEDCHQMGFLELLKRQHIRQTGTKIACSNFLICIYYTINIYLKLILRVYEQLYLPDIMMKIMIIILSYYMNTIQLAQICATVGLRYETKHMLQEHVEMIDIHIQENKELKKYKNRLYECLSAEWSISGNLRFRDLCQVTYQESLFLRRNVNDEYILWILEQTEFFKHFPRDLLFHLAHRSQIFLIPEKHELVKFDERCFYLYIVVQGFCIGKNFTAGDWERNRDTYYKPLDVFPLLEFLHQVNSWVTVNSHTAVQLITIPYSVFHACVGLYNQEKLILTRTLESHMQKFWGMLKRSTAIGALLNEEQGADDKPVMFTYEIHRQKMILDITNCSVQQSRDSTFLKYRHILTLVAQSTYNPNSRYYIAYEAFRCLCILIHVNLTYYMCVAAVYKSVWTHATFYLLYALWVFDVIIQGHLQYYNEWGISVHALIATTKHYLKNSFLVDLLAGLPYEFLNFHKFVRDERQLAVQLLFTVNTKVFLLFRPFMLSDYLQDNSVTKSQKLLKYISNVLIIYHFIMHLATMKLLLTCDIRDDRSYVCPNNSWIQMRTTFTEWDESKYYWITVRSVLVTGVSVGDSVSSRYDHLVTLTIGMLMVGLRIGFLGKITGDNCIRQARLVEHQDALKRYNDFFRNRLVSNNTKNEMLNHYKNIWQRSYSEKSKKIFDNIYPHLRETLMLTMYKTAVSKCILFTEQNIVLFKLFIPYLEERYYTKGAQIIRTNDVQGNVFIVVKGQVEMSMAGARLAMLGPGGIFGCFEPLGLNRHTMAATAQLHTNVLVIKSTRYYQLIKGFNKTEGMMRNLRYTQFQYAQMGTRKEDLRESFMSTGSGLSYGLYVKYRRVYKLYMYVTNVHVAPISAYMVLTDCHLETGVMKLLPLWIILDIYFSLCFIFRGRIPTIDSKTGMEINKKRELQRHYIKSFMFVIDIMSILPIYLIRIWMHQDYHQIWFLLNKLLRIYFLYHHYHGYVLAKNIPRHLQWTLLVYSTLFLAEVIFITWWFIIELPYEQKTDAVYLFQGYISMMNYVSTCGLLVYLDYKPTYVIQLTIDMILVLMSTGLTIGLATLFTKGVISGNAYECVYRYRARFCKQFCRVSSVSNALVTRMWDYFHYLYKKQGGDQFPQLYRFAPKYLKQDHMQSLFGKHFNDHPLFFDLHIDLLKQIQTYIRCYYLIPGDTILERGCKNGEIYFIESGSILAIQATSDEDPAPTYEVLEPGNSFGEVQAFLKLQHTKTYKALTAIDLIAITVSEWEYLLDWFPASKQKLVARIEEHADLLKYKK